MNQANTHKNDSGLQSIWFWIIGVLLLIIIGLALILWSSYERRFDQNATVIETVKAAAEVSNRSNQSASPHSPSDQSLPVPAKKIESLLNDDQTLTNDALEERIATLDKQIEAINKQLKTQGITPPQPAELPNTQNSKTLRDTQDRLTRIKEFMEQRDQ